MREIKFRGKDRKTGKWFFGNLFDKDTKGNTHICTTRKGSLDVIPETVGQYTGLKDRNGKEIYEGDVIECWSEGVKARGVVTHRIDGTWIMYPAWQNAKMWYLMPDEDGNTSVEIIGNIHDNPELI